MHKSMGFISGCVSHRELKHPGKTEISGMQEYLHKFLTFQQSHCCMPAGNTFRHHPNCIKLKMTGNFCHCIQREMVSCPMPLHIGRLCDCFGQEYLAEMRLCWV